MNRALPPFKRAWPRSAIALALMSAFQLPAVAQQTMQVIDVIGATPLPGIGQARNEIAAPVQSAKSGDLERSGALELGDFMNRRLGSVHVNEMQGNPFQMDVSYRGYTASPLLGTAQGLSVYLDGVRMNQPFGDVVSWDLIARAAIASMTLMPGSNPLFGLNTLGGALSVQTKDGLRNRGTVVQATVGANGRRAAEFEHGGANEQGWNWYATGNRFKERGWRDDSPSDVRQLFGKLGWQDSATNVSLTLALADNDLAGNGLQEQRFLARDRASVYTIPDVTQNRSALLNLAAGHAVNDALQLSGNLYYRTIRSATFNGDLNSDALNQSVYQPNGAERGALSAAGYTGFPTEGANAANTPLPFWRCLGQTLLNGEPAKKCNGVLNRTHSDQQNHGLSGQLTALGTLAGQRNQFVAGAAYDASRIAFTQSSQLGYLNADRGITAVNAFGDGGVTGGNVDGVPYDTRVDLSGRIRTWSAFASDTVSIRNQWHLTLAGRYNTTSITNRDQIHADSDSASLSGAHRFARFNPAAGITFTPTAAFNAYAGINESSRAPTSIELGCANPEQPCKLPNAMAGDPPLAQVITRTVELGVRGTGAHLNWNAGVFSAENKDDILFVADNESGYGYFKNFGKTRRRGVELGLSGKLDKVNLGAQLTLLDATYRSAETVNSSSNSSNDAAAAGTPGVDGTIAIRPGDRMPLVPRQMLKLFADYALSPSLMIDAGVVAVSSALARGNENKGHAPDGVYYLGQGYSAGYVVANLGASLRLSPRWQLLAHVNNVFDTRYNSAAQLGATAFDANGNFVARPFIPNNDAIRHSTFYAPGAPRLISATLRYRFGAPGGV